MRNRIALSAAAIAAALTIPAAAVAAGDDPPGTSSTEAPTTSTTVAAPPTTEQPTVIHGEDCDRIIVSLVNTFVYVDTTFTVQVGDDPAATYRVAPNDTLALTVGPDRPVKIWISGDYFGQVEPVACEISTPPTPAPVVPVSLPETK